MTSLPLRTSRGTESEDNEKKRRNGDEVSTRDYEKGDSKEKNLQKVRSIVRRQSWLDKLVFKPVTCHAYYC